MCLPPVPVTRAPTDLLLDCYNHYPCRPWSHVFIDFVTGLPPSDSNTTILTVVGRFLKMVHFIPVKKLPPAREMTELMLHHVFRHHGFLADVVLDRGPPFVFRFWKAFCSLVGASLSSGYHPQPNGQSERMKQELEKGLQCLVAQTPAQWSGNLLRVEFAHNSLASVSSSIYASSILKYRFSLK